MPSSDLDDLTQLQTRRFIDNKTQTECFLHLSKPVTLKTQPDDQFTFPNTQPEMQITLKMQTRQIEDSHHYL